MQGRNPDNYKAIDISSNNPDIDLAKVKAAGFQIVYIKATEGLRYINPLMSKHYQEAKAQGLLVGFYHFFNSSNATEQAAHFCNTIAAMPYDCLPCLDVEAKPDRMDKVAFSAFVHEALNQIAYLTKRWPVIYANTNYCRNFFVAEQVNMYPLWIADYNSSGFPGNNPIWGTWAGWQYSNAGNIGGITVDVNEFTSDILLASHENIPSPEPAGGVKIILQGFPLNVKVDISDGHARVYVRELFEAMSYTVTWDEANQLIKVG